MALQVRKHLHLRGDTKQRMGLPMKLSDSIYQYKETDILKSDSLLGLQNRKYSKTIMILTNKIDTDKTINKSQGIKNYMHVQTVLSAGKRPETTHNWLCLPFSDWMKMWRDTFKPITLLFETAWFAFFTRKKKRGKTESPTALIS